MLEWCLDDYPNRHSFPKSDPQSNSQNYLHHSSPSTHSGNRQDAEPVGPTVDLMRELALRAGFVLKFSPDTPFARCLKQMASGKTDLMINLNYSEQRSAYMHLLPYSKGLPEVLYFNPRYKTIRSFEQLQQTTVALVRGYVYADALLHRMQQQQLKVHEADTLDNALGLLLRNRVDAVVAPQQQAAYIVASQPQYQQQFQLIALEPALVTELYAHLGFSKRSAYPHLLPVISKTLQQMVAEGVIERLHREPTDTLPPGNSSPVD